MTRKADAENCGKQKLCLFFLPPSPEIDLVTAAAFLVVTGMMLLQPGYSERFDVDVLTSKAVCLEGYVSEEKTKK